MRPGQRERDSNAAAEAVSAVDSLVDAGLALSSARSLGQALQTVVEVAARATAADVVVARVLDATRAQLRACAVASTSPAVAAGLEGSRFPAKDLPTGDVSSLEGLPAAARVVADRLGATAVLQVPVWLGDRPAGSLELMRAGAPFDDAQRLAARLAAAQAGLAIRAFDEGPERGGRPARDDVLSLAGDALAAAADDARTPEQVTRLAAEATGALAALLWRMDEEEQLTLVASFGLSSADATLADAREAAARGLAARAAVGLETAAGRLPRYADVSATLQLGQPPLGALQLLFASEREPTESELVALGTFGVRAAHALRTSMRARTLTLELARTRALLAVVGQAISQLSLAHTLETAVARVAELLGAERLAIYLRDQDRLYAAAGLGLTGPHLRVAERLLELALGPLRGRGLLVVDRISGDPRLASAADAASEAGIETAIAVPLLVRGEAIGMLGVYPSERRGLTENETSLLGALASQLAVVVQNAQLHEEMKRAGEEREEALRAEKAAARQMGALYEISRSFAQSLSLDATLDALAATLVDAIDGVDVALIALPDERREWLVPRAIHVDDERALEAVRGVVYRPQPFGAHPTQRLFRLGEPYELTRAVLQGAGGEAAALVPFLERGWTGAVVPIATPAEVLASLTILSLRPGVPVRPETIDQAAGIVGQAALAIDNARLYQQQKEFADTMQRSLLPRSLPKLEGLDLGDAYVSSARVEVGGDVYDFVELDDGRLAVVLGDVTGHGIEAAADMAMAKFVFRSLAREHPEPGDFLQSANEVVVGEIAPGKFITMVYLAVDADRGEVAGAVAGHPPPRIVSPDGSVRPLDAQGLVLGVEAGQTYQEVREPLEPGAAVILYTDGVTEARRDGELYGFERLDAFLSEWTELPAQELADAVLADCRSFARGELADDCAIVVVKRTA